MQVSKINQGFKEIKTVVKRIYFWAAIYGMISLLPLYFLESTLAKLFPPASNHPEQYYGFIGIAIAWQFVFLLISQDPIRYRAFMIPAILEKLIVAGTVIWLFLIGRVDCMTLIPFTVDLLIGVLFIVAYVYTK